MRYVSSVKHLLFISVLTGLLGGVFFSTTANAVTTTGSYELKGKSQVIIRDTDIHNDNIYVALDNEPGASFSKDNKGTETCTLWLNSSDQTKLLKGEKPSTIRYEIKACSAKGNYQTKLLSGSGDAIDQQKKEDAKTDKAKVSAVAKYLIDKAPLLQMEYNGKLKNPDETGPAISACISQAVAQTAESEKLNAQAGLPAKNSDQIKDSHNNNFAICYAAKSGNDKDVILKYLKEQSGSEDLIGSAATIGSDAAGDKQDEPDEEPSCGTEISGIGWIVCPVIDALSTLNDGLWKIIEGLLQSNPLEQSGAMYDLWTILRNIANALLVVGFIAIIYAQLTGIGISNYGVKKMLPRLVIVAIAINLSYFIVTIMVDVFNILGSSLHDLLNDVYNNLGIGDDFTWGSLMGLILSGAGAVAISGVAVLASGGTVALILLMLPSALAGLIGFLAALLTLMFRQAAIPLLAILAPIAFVAYLLPNTESLFTKWRKMFTSMLILYPLAALLFGGMKVAGAVIASGGTGTGKAFALLTGLIVMAAPLFMLPFLAKQSGSMLGTLGGKLQGLGSKLGKPVGSWSKGRAEKSRKRYESMPLRMGANGKPIMRDRLRGMRRNISRRSQYRDHRNDLITGAYDKQQAADFNERFSGEAESIAEGMAPGVAQRQIQTIGATMSSQAEEEEVKQILTQFRSQNPAGKDSINKASGALKSAIESGDVATARAMQQHLLNSGGLGIQELNKLYGDEKNGITGASGSMATNVNAKDMHKSLSADLLNAGVKGSSAALDRYATSGKDADFSKIANDSSVYSALNTVELAGQKNVGDLITSGKVTPEMASAVMRSDVARAKLSTENLAKMEQQAAKAVAPARADNSAPPEFGSPSSSSFEQADNGLYIPRDKK